MAGGWRGLAAGLSRANMRVTNDSYRRYDGVVTQGKIMPGADETASGLA